MPSATPPCYGRVVRGRVRGLGLCSRGEVLAPMPAEAPLVGLSLQPEAEWLELLVPLVEAHCDAWFTDRKSVV